MKIIEDRIGMFRELGDNYRASVNAPSRKVVCVDGPRTDWDYERIGGTLLVLATGSRPPTGPIEGHVYRGSGEVMHYVGTLVPHTIQNRAEWEAFYAGTLAWMGDAA